MLFYWVRPFFKILFRGRTKKCQTYTNEGVSASDCSVELCRHSKIDQLDIGVVREQHILSLDVSVYDLVDVEVSEAAEDLATNVGDPLLLEEVALGRLDQVGDRARAAVLHHQPQLIVLVPAGRLLDERAVVGGNVSMMRELLQHVDLELDLLLFLLGHVHALDGGELARLGVTALVDLAVGAVADYLDQVEDARGVLERGQVDLVQRAVAWRRAQRYIHLVVLFAFFPLTRVDVDGYFLLNSLISELF